MSTPASAPASSFEEVFETIVDSQQSKLIKGVKRRIQRQRAAALLKSAAVRAEEQAARCLQDQRETEEQLRQLDSQLRHSKTESHSFSVAAKRYKQDKQAAHELAAQISEKEALVTELQFQIQDIGGRRHKASLDRVSAFLGDPANVFAVPTARHGTFSETQPIITCSGIQFALLSLRILNRYLCAMYLCEATSIFSLFLTE